MATTKTRSKTAKRRIDEPQSDGRQQDRTAGLNATIISRGFAASLRRRAKGQQRIARGAQTCPTESTQSVSEHRCFRKRNETEKHRADNKSSPQMRTPVSDQLSAQPPISGRNTTLVAAKHAITRPTLNGVPPNEVM